MTFSVSVTEIDAKGVVVRSHGVHEFLWPPAPGDQVVVPSVAIGISIMRVAYTEHSPQWPAPHLNEPDSGPKATIFVHWVSDED